MSTRDLINPSRQLHNNNSTFKLQPPPVRRKKGYRKCSVIAGQKDLKEGEISAAILITPSGPNFFSQPITSPQAHAHEHQLPSVFEDDTPANDKFRQMPRVESSKRTKRSTESITFDGSKQCGVLNTQPMIAGSRICDSPLAIGSNSKAEGSINGDKTPKSTTSSYFNLARNNFGTAMRKRRSQLSISIPFKSKEKIAKTDSIHHTILCLSPESPLSPGSRFSLHSPKVERSNTAGFLIIKTETSVESGPLSATLKRLGAVREFPSPASSSYNESEEGKESNISTATPLTSFETRLAHRVFLNEKAICASEEIKLRVQEASFLFSVSVYTDEEENYDSVSSLYPPSRDCRNQSTIRGGQRKSALQSKFLRFSTLFSGYTMRSVVKFKTAEAEGGVVRMSSNEPSLNRPEPVLAKEKADGWGGFLPRESWFTYGTLGPNITPDTSPCKNIRFRPLILQGETHSKKEEEEIWMDEDEVETMVGHSPIVKAEDKPIQKLRVHFPDVIPKSSRIAGEMSKEAKRAHEEALALTYTSNSVEGCPLKQRSRLHFFNEYYGLLVSLVIIMIMGIVALIVALSSVKRHQNAIISS